MTPAAIATDLISQFSSADFPATLAAYADQLSLEVLRELADRISRALSRKPGQALILAQVAQAVAERLGDPFAQAMALNFLAAAHNHSGDLPQALALSHQAEAAFQVCQQPLRVTSVKINRVATLRNMGRYAEAIDLAAEARAEYQALGDPRPDFLANLEVNVAWALWQTGDIGAAAGCYERAGQTYEALGQQWAAAVTYMDRAILAEEQACFATAEDLLGQARAILAAEDLAKERAHVDLNLGILAFKTGRLQAALHHLELAHHELESQQLAHAVATVNHYRAQVYLQLNLAQEAIRLAHQARQSFKRDRRAGMLLLSHLNLASGYRQLGQLTTAHDYLNRARRLARRLAAAPTLNEIDTERARLALDQRLPGRARRIARQVLKRLKPLEQPTLALDLRLIEAQSDLMSGRWQRASQALQTITQAAPTALTPALRLQLAWLQAELQTNQAAYVEALAAYENAAQQLLWQHEQLISDETGLDFLADKTGILAGMRRCSHMLATTGRFSLTQLATKLELALELPAAASSPSSPAQPNGQMVALQQRWHWLQNRLESPFTLLDDTARRELDPEQLRQELRQVEMELAELHRRQQAGTLVNTPARATSAPTPAPERPDPGTAVLHFYQVDDQCQALLISAAGSQLFSGLASTRF
ncbi:MAG: tetratricopeptide repeat protein, partial [Anaerolineales bacterium]|nr:tetratricopeptide repeat protein [Anaerolineales bacterium]